MKYISQPAEDVSIWLPHKWNIGFKWVKGFETKQESCWTNHPGVGRVAGTQ